MAKPTKGKLTIIYMCTECGVAYEGVEGYNLDHMYGIPRVCPTCVVIWWEACKQ